MTDARETAMSAPEPDRLQSYERLRADGATPADVVAAAGREGMPKVEIIRILRALFGLSFEEAKGVVGDERVRSGPRAIGGAEELAKYLENELGYCSCAGGEPLVLLRDVLRVIEERSEATGDQERFSAKTAELRLLLRLDESFALGASFLHAIESKGLIWHGFNTADCWITDDGRSLLRALVAYDWPS